MHGRGWCAAIGLLIASLGPGSLLAQASDGLAAVAKDTAPVSSPALEASAVVAPTPSTEPARIRVPIASLSLHGPRTMDALASSPAERAVSTPSSDFSPTRQQSKAMMIAGGTAFLAGAIIGGKPGVIFMVGGATVGLVGLYHWVQ